MTEKTKYAYDYIVNYIKNNKSKLDIEELKFLLKYVSYLNKVDLDNVAKADINLIINDLKKLHKHLSESTLTSVSFSRLEKEIKLFDSILQNKNLDDISYELDKLYIECDMGVRKNSTLVKKLLSLSFNKETEKKVTKWR